MKKITVIIPLNNFNDDIKKSLDNAISSIIKQDLTYIDILLFKNSNINFNLNDINQYYSNIIIRDYDDINNELNIQNIINLAFIYVNTPYFSILNYKDEYSLTYFNNVINHINEYPNVDIFMPIIIESSDDNKYRYVNEITWSRSIIGENGELGYLNSNVINEFTFFNIYGSVIKSVNFNIFGKFKVNFKEQYMYEFLLRAINNGLNIYTIPKVSYKHIIENKIIDNNIIENINKWNNLARIESNFINDRNIV